MVNCKIAETALTSDNDKLDKVDIYICNLSQICNISCELNKLNAPKRMNPIIEISVIRISLFSMVNWIYFIA